MGRYNNRRTQAAAAALKNTPSRARFSKGPPRKNTKPKRNSNNNNNNSNNKSHSAATKAKVIDKLQTRVSNQTAPRVATTEEALHYLDKSKLDHLKLPQDILQNITNLLEQLGVKRQEQQQQDVLDAAIEQENNGGMEEDADDSNIQEDEGNTIKQALHYTDQEDDFMPDAFAVSSGYTEYEDDVVEQDGHFMHGAPSYNPYDNEYDAESDDGGAGESFRDNGENNTTLDNDAASNMDFQDHPAFVHLTQRLSFQVADALQACQAIQDWDAIAVQDPSNENSTENDNTKDPKESIALAMDWLCLHLTENQLTQGFRPNPNPPKATSLTNANTGSKSGIPAIGSIKAIPHPSISLATDTVSDKVWARSVRLQERTLKFVRLGFSLSEATQACEATAAPKDSEEDDTALTKLPPESDPALIQLLTSIARNASADNNAEEDMVSSMTPTDLAYAAEERQQEREALEAIYDDQIQIQSATSSAGEQVLEKYVLKILPVEDLQEPARSDECFLHIFLRSGYPVLQTPLFWFTNPSLPPSLLRTIHEAAAKTATESLGAPAVFEVVTFLAEHIPSLQLDFIRAQKRKEFEAQQARLRQQADAKSSSAVATAVMDRHYYDADGDDKPKLGRRQRAKPKAAEKAYDRDDQMQQEFLEFRKKQDERIQRVQEENTRIRAVHAENALSKREEERVLQEAERLARSAMNRAFNQGQTADEARAAADEARTQYLQDNGMDPDLDNGDGTNGAPSQDKEAKALSKATKNTSAFMKRLATKTQGGESTSGYTDSERLNDQLKEDDEGEDALDDTEMDAQVSNSTPTTAAFMQRLRQMYDHAAKKKAGFHLTEPKTKEKEDPGDKNEPNHNHTPCPVAAPTDELNEVMTDILKQQEEQPWLVAPEARVPTKDDEIPVDESLSPEQVQRQKSISKKLKDDLIRKRKAAATWAESNSTATLSAPGKKMSGFSPQKFHFMMSVRQRLPAFKMATDVVQTIEANQITVIAGDTGCGKTTQVPQLVLDDRVLNGRGAATNIIVTQPRRISAIGVSERIADERCERVGETCGYSIKLEKKMTSKTRLLLCTTGVLLRRLQCDPDLASVSHVFVDEVHERDLNTDFLIIILKDLLARRRNLKLVLMSATLNSDAFSKYFFGCPIVSIPGRAHPVKENRLEDILELTKYEVQEGSDYALKKDDSNPPKISKSALRRRYYPKYSKETIHSLSVVDETIINYELVAALLEYIATNEEEGAILVFMPGMMEITKTVEEMYKKEFFQSDKVRIYPLHSSLSTAEQTAIFEVPPEGVRKIVVSTNIAETSITIEDVVFVVDSGKVKENRRDEINETPTLVECWVSRASAKQRRGRAGRVRPGVAYHLYSSHTHDDDLMDYQLPEMLRVGIEDLVLQVLILDLGEPSTFLGKALNPPTDLAMSNSLKLLETLGAVECKWIRSIPGKQQKNGESTTETQGQLQVSSELTALGFHLATLPVDPRVGKLMIYGSLLGCVDAALTIAASMASRSPFVSPFDQREAADEARKTFAVEGSDHLTILNAFEQWKSLKRSKKGNRAVNAFLKENFLGRLTLHQMEDLRNQFAKLLKDIGFLTKDFNLRQCVASPENTNSQNIGLVKAVLCAGLYPNILVAPRPLVSASSNGKKSDKKAGECAFQSHRKGEVYLHPSTIAFDQPSLDSRYCCYHEIVKTSKIYARDTTTVSPFALLLFGGTLKVYQTHGICSVDDWLKFRIDAKPATLIKYLRGQLEKFLLQKIVNPQDEVIESDEGRALIQSINMLFASKEILPAPEPDRSAADIVRPWNGLDEGDGGRQNNGRGRRQGQSNRRGGRGRGGRGRGSQHGNSRGRGSR